MYVNVCLFPKRLFPLDDFGNAELFTSTEYRSLTNSEFLHHFFEGVIFILSFLSLLDAASLFVAGGIIEELLYITPSDDSLTTKLFGFQILVP